MEFDDLIKEIKKYNKEANFDLIREAYEFSKEAHKGQKRVSGEEFIQHPLEVARILAEMKLDEEIIMAALLHDVVEDSEVRYKEIEKRFGKNVALIVRGVTRIKELKKKISENYEAESVRKMLIATAKDIRVIILKLADKLHNMRTLKYLPKEKRRVISRYVLDVYAPIAFRLGLAAIKWELEDLAFRYTEPEIFKEFQRRVVKGRKQREGDVNRVIKILSEELKKNGIGAEITGRPKHFYSIYQKMKEKKREFEEIYDLVAVRVITGSVEDCYKALGVVHNLWKPIPKRFKDFIANPKENMYQSLHTVVIGSEDEKVEFQIRTREMHNVAEEGIAAHWQYKRAITEGKFDKRLSWLRQILDWERESKLDIMEAMKVNLFGDSIFTFTPKGDIIELPRKATPVDFAYAVHSELGDRCIGARVNDKFVSLRYELEDGDMVEILTSKRQSPSRGWLKFVRSSKAKEKIRRAIRLRREIPIRSPGEIKEEEESKGLLEVEGVENGKIRIAKCCDILPGDKVVGLKSRSGKINVHLIGCEGILSSSRVKVKLEWRDHFRGVVRFRVESVDRVGILADILNTIAAAGGDIKDIRVNIVGGGPGNYAEDLFSIDFRGLEELKKLMLRIKKIADVRRVRIE